MPGPLAAHRELIVLAEAACAHVQAERWDELAVTQDTLAERLAVLRGNHPPESAPALARVRSLNDQVVSVLAARRSAVLAELAGVRVGRDAASGYSPADGGLDRSAIDHAA